MSPIVLEGASKAFRIFSERNQSIKQALLRRRRARYDDFWALRDVSFSVPAGTTFGIVGSNGSGKSTTLKLLSQILVPDEGKITVQGRVSALLELGAGFHPDLTGRENVFLNGSILGLSRKTLSNRFDEIVDFAGLGSFIDNPVKTYSSGMYARLGFAVAVNVDPDILLIDEVLAVGDEQFQRKCAEKIGELRAGGRTVVLVSHNLGSIKGMCDSSVWIDQGSVRAIGNTADVVDMYVGALQPTAVVDDSGRLRTGSGEARVSATIINEVGGLELQRLNRGDRAIVELRVVSRTAIRHAQLSFEVRRSGGGPTLGGSRTQFALPTLEIRQGENIVRYEIDHIPLLIGTYEIGTELIDLQSRHIFDHCEQSLRFDVGPTSDSSQFGLFDLRGSWRVAP